MRQGKVTVHGSLVSLRTRLNALDERVLPEAGKKPMPRLVRAAGYFLSLGLAMLIPGLVRHEPVGLFVAAVAGVIGLALLTWWLVQRRAADQPR